MEGQETDHSHVYLALSAISLVQGREVGGLDGVRAR